MLLATQIESINCTLALKKEQIKAEDKRLTHEYCKSMQCVGRNLSGFVLFYQFSIRAKTNTIVLNTATSSRQKFLTLNFPILQTEIQKLKYYGLSQDKLIDHHAKLKLNRIR